MPSQIALRFFASKAGLETQGAGLEIVDVPVSEAELDWLVAKKYLAEEERENKVAIKHAIESVLSAKLKAAAL